MVIHAQKSPHWFQCKVKWNLNLIPQKSTWGHLDWTFHLLTPWWPFAITLSPHLTSASQTHLTDIKQGSRPITSPYWLAAAAAAKSLQSCPTLCDPMDCSLPGSPVHGIFQARILEWGAIGFSDWLARKRHFLWNQSPKQEVEEKKKRPKFRVKTDLNPNPSSSTLWLRATLSLEPQFLHL